MPRPARAGCGTVAPNQPYAFLQHDVGDPNLSIPATSTASATWYTFHTNDQSVFATSHPFATGIIWPPTNAPGDDTLVTLKDGVLVCEAVAYWAAGSFTRAINIQGWALQSDNNSQYAVDQRQDVSFYADGFGVAVRDHAIGVAHVTAPLNANNAWQTSLDCTNFGGASHNLVSAFMMVLWFPADGIASHTRVYGS